MFVFAIAAVQQRPPLQINELNILVNDLRGKLWAFALFFSDWSSCQLLSVWIVLIMMVTVIIASNPLFAKSPNMRTNSPNYRRRPPNSTSVTSWNRSKRRNSPWRKKIRRFARFFFTAVHSDIESSISVTCASELHSVEIFNASFHPKSIKCRQWILSSFEARKC